MAISRPILLALAAAILALVAFYATTSARTSTDESNEPAKAVRDSAPARSKAARKPTSAHKDESRPATGAAGSSARRDAGGAARRGVPAAVARALARDRTVVLFFFQRGAADDDATAQAVAAVRRRGAAKVFSAPISRLADYGAITTGAGVSQAPAVVIVGKRGSARLVEGFVDPETLIQQVADAR